MFRLLLARMTFLGLAGVGVTPRLAATSGVRAARSLRLRRGSRVGRFHADPAVASPCRRYEERLPSAGPAPPHGATEKSLPAAAARSSRRHGTTHGKTTLLARHGTGHPTCLRGKAPTADRASLSAAARTTGKAGSEAADHGGTALRALPTDDRSAGDTPEGRPVVGVTGFPPTIPLSRSGGTRTPPEPGPCEGGSGERGTTGIRPLAGLFVPPPLFCRTGGPTTGCPGGASDRGRGVFGPGCGAGPGRSGKVVSPSMSMATGRRLSADALLRPGEAPSEAPLYGCG